MSTNPSISPSPIVEVSSRSNETPSLWNPSAAARWSFLLSPIFGATLQMKNWQALGEPARAAQSKQWALWTTGVFAFLLLLSIFMPESKAVDIASRAVGLGLLVAWYSVSARAQIGYVAARFGTSYPRRGWGRPFLYAILCIFAFLGAAFVVAMVVGLLQGEG